MTFSVFIYSILGLGLVIPESTLLVLVQRSSVRVIVIVLQFISGKLSALSRSLIGSITR